MNEKSMNLRCNLLTGLALVVFSVQILAQGGGPALVRVTQAQMMDMAPTMQVAGTVISRQDATLAAEVEGRLMEVTEAGTRVDAGDLVARIDDTALALRIEELEAEVERAEASLRYLESELERQQRMAERELAAANLLDQTRSERDMAAGQLRATRARLAQTRDQLDRTRIRAPFSGVVAERLLQAGERVAAGTSVVRLYNPRRLEVVARAPLDYYAYVQAGDILALTAGSRELEASVRTTVSVGSESSHVFEIRLDVTDHLPVGQTVRVSIPMDRLREVLAVPRDALVLRGDGAAVYVVDNGNQAQRVSVSTGIGSGDLIEVRGNLQAGDRVVVRGNERLRAGQSVEVMEDGAS